jgi:predicted amidohydrolase YtcJ
MRTHKSLSKASKILLLISAGLVVSVGFFLTCSLFPSHADMILHHAKIYTMDVKGTIGEAVAIKDGKVIAVGSNDDILRKYKSEKIIDLQNGVVFPGFIDAHAHLLGLAVKLSTLDFEETSSPEQVAAMVGNKAKQSKPGEWILGRGWDQNKWKTKQFPSHGVLDAAVADNPVYLIRVDGHAVWTNEKVLDIAGVTKGTKEPEGGKIVRDRSGEPTGVFIDAAISLVDKFRPEMTDEQKERALKLAMQECVGYGLTEVHDMGIDSSTIKVYRRMIDTKQFPLRVYAMIDGPGKTWDYYLRHGKEIYSGSSYFDGGPRLTIGGIKLYADGALGSRGAALVEPYSDDPGNRGLTEMSEDSMYRVTSQAVKKGFQVCTHAIGDRGNHIVLNAYERTLKELPQGEHRLRVEHVQVLLQTDIPRFKALGIIPSMQPTHCTSDMYWAEARLGLERVKGAYAWRSLLNTGTIIPGGSDFPVEGANPLFGIYAAVARQDQKGLPRNWVDVAQYFQFSPEGLDTTQFNGGWYPQQRMRREEAIRAFTNWAAYASFEENIKGSLEEGKLADLVVLSQDIMTIEPTEISSTEILLTMVGGEIVHKGGRLIAID